MKAWADKNTTILDQIYLDHGRRHEADKRPEFQRLIKSIEKGEIATIVIDQQDRFGFSSVFEWYAYLYLLQKHDCTLVSAIDGKVLSQEDPASFITTGINAHASKEEMVKKSSRDLGKKVEMARRGEWPGGWIPYGCDVVCRSINPATRRTMLESVLAPQHTRCTCARSSWRFARGVSPVSA